MASKSTDIRPKITLACTECKERNYITRKNRRNDPDRMELKKYCPRCRMPPARTARPADLRTHLLRRLASPAASPTRICPAGAGRVVGSVASMRPHAARPGLAGRTFEPTPPYTVSREKIAEFTRAIGATRSTTARRRR